MEGRASVETPTESSAQRVSGGGPDRDRGSRGGGGPDHDRGSRDGGGRDGDRDCEIATCRVCGALGGAQTSFARLELLGIEYCSLTRHHVFVFGYSIPKLLNMST